MIDIQGLIIYNPKTKEHLVRIGNLLFPFKTANEVLSYFLGKFKITKKLKIQKANSDTVSNYSFFIILSKSILYLTSYCKKLLNHFNRFLEGDSFNGKF